jgi:hypothetical protein
MMSAKLAADGLVAMLTAAAHAAVFQAGCSMSTGLLTSTSAEWRFPAAGARDPAALLSGENKPHLKERSKMSKKFYETSESINLDTFFIKLTDHTILCLIPIRVLRFLFMRNKFKFLYSAESPSDLMNNTHC